MSQQLSNLADLVGTNRQEVVMKPVTYYGCVRCQAYHFEDTEPDIFNLHLYWQEKHGTKELYETMEERKQRYEKRFLSSEDGSAGGPIPVKS